jgi:hypothetical protein
LGCPCFQGLGRTIQAVCRNDNVQRSVWPDFVWCSSNSRSFSMDDTCTVTTSGDRFCSCGSEYERGTRTR